MISAVSVAKCYRKRRCSLALLMEGRNQECLAWMGMDLMQSRAAAWGFWCDKLQGPAVLVGRFRRRRKGCILNIPRVDPSLRVVCPSGEMAEYLRLDLMRQTKCLSLVPGTGVRDILSRLWMSIGDGIFVRH